MISGDHYRCPNAKPLKSVVNLLHGKAPTSLSSVGTETAPLGHCMKHYQCQVLTGLLKTMAAPRSFLHTGHFLSRVYSADRYPSAITLKINRRNFLICFVSVFASRRLSLWTNSTVTFVPIQTEVLEDHGVALLWQRKKVGDLFMLTQGNTTAKTGKKDGFSFKEVILWVDWNPIKSRVRWRVVGTEKERVE